MSTCVSLLVLAFRSAVAVQLRASQGVEADVTAVAEGLHSRLELHRMTDKIYDGGAVCLDGSAAAFYFAPASDFGPENENANDWQIAFEGGGWCSDEQECIEKAHTGLGSSKGYPEQYIEKPHNLSRTLGGFMSDNCTINPTFCQYNKVLVMNCDGTSFTGDWSEPVKTTDANGMPVTLHFRGAHILRAVMDTLFTKGLQDAKNVVLTGYSSGGLSTLLHADYVRERLIASAPKLINYRAVPISGFVLDHEVMESEIQNMVELANSTGALDKQCVKQFEQQKKGSAWKCFFAPNAYGFLKTPVFFFNSGIDQWQISLLHPEVPAVQVLSEIGNGTNITDGNTPNGVQDLERVAWSSCFQSVGLGGCSEDQVQDMMQFHTTFEHVLFKNMRSSGNGAFVHTCPLHDAALDDESFKNLIVGKFSIQEAITDWWTSPRTSSTSKHTTLDCHLDATHALRMCNPSCPLLVEHSR